MSDNESGSPQLENLNAALDSLRLVRQHELLGDLPYRCEDYPCCGHTDGLPCNWVSPSFHSSVDNIIHSVELAIERVQNALRWENAPLGICKSDECDTDSENPPTLPVLDWHGTPMCNECWEYAEEADRDLYRRERDEGLYDY